MLEDWKVKQFFNISLRSPIWGGVKNIQMEGHRFGQFLNFVEGQINAKEIFWIII